MSWGIQKEGLTQEDISGIYRAVHVASVGASPVSHDGPEIYVWKEGRKQHLGYDPNEVQHSELGSYDRIEIIWQDMNKEISAEWNENTWNFKGIDSKQDKEIIFEALS